MAWWKTLASGLWSNTTTVWSRSNDNGSTWAAAGGTPADGDTVNVLSTHTVTFDGDHSGYSTGVYLRIDGTLQFQNNSAGTYTICFSGDVYQVTGVSGYTSPGPGTFKIVGTTGDASLYPSDHTAVIKGKYSYFNGPSVIIHCSEPATPSVRILNNTKPISNITLDGNNFVTVTCNSHGYIDDTSINLFSIGGTVELNDGFYRVKYVNSNQFQLKWPETEVLVDGTGFGVYTNGGYACTNIVTSTSVLTVDTDVSAQWANGSKVYISDTVGHYGYFTVASTGSNTITLAQNLNINGTGAGQYSSPITDTLRGGARMFLVNRNVKTTGDWSNAFINSGGATVSLSMEYASSLVGVTNVSATITGGFWGYFNNYSYAFNMLTSDSHAITIQAGIFAKAGFVYGGSSVDITVNDCTQINAFTTYGATRSFTIANGTFINSSTHYQSAANITTGTFLYCSLAGLGTITNGTFRGFTGIKTNNGKILAGLFTGGGSDTPNTCYVSDGTVSNLAISGGNFHGFNYVFSNNGAVSNATVKDCTFLGCGTFLSGNSYAYGWYQSFKNVTIKNCTNANGIFYSLDYPLYLTAVTCSSQTSVIQNCRQVICNSCVFGGSTTADVIKSTVRATNTSWSTTPVAQGTTSIGSYTPVYRSGTSIDSVVSFDDHGTTGGGTPATPQVRAWMPSGTVAPSSSHLTSPHGYEHTMTFEQLPFASPPMTIAYPMWLTPNTYTITIDWIKNATAGTMPILPTAVLIHGDALNCAEIESGAIIGTPATITDDLVQHTSTVSATITREGMYSLVFIGQLTAGVGPGNGSANLLYYSWHIDGTQLTPIYQYSKLQFTNSVSLGQGGRIFFLMEAAPSSPTVQITKNDGSPASTSDTINTLAGGVFYIDLTTTETNTAGELLISVTETGRPNYYIVVPVMTEISRTTFVQPSSVPNATTSLDQQIAWLYTLARNKITQNSTTQTLRDDGDSSNIGTATVSDDGSTFTRDKWTT